MLTGRPVLPFPHRRRRATLALALLPLLAGCVYRYDVSPAPVPNALPAPATRIERTLVLLLTPAFSEVRHTRDNGDVLERVVVTTTTGAVADSLLRDWAERSSAAVEVRRLSETDALRTFVSSASPDELLVLPRFEGPQGAPLLGSEPVFAGVRLDVRSPRTGAVHSWLGSSRVGGGWLVHGSGRRTGRALAEALRSATDSLVRYRNEF